LTRGVVNVIPEKEGLIKLLKEEKKLNIYFGIDPTATRIHLGHTVPLRKLQALADLGHSVTFLIGDFTALIGDTSDKDSERPVLTSEEIEQNFKTYRQQAEKVISFNNITVKHNSEWLGKLSFSEIVKLCQHFSVGDFVGRELIKKRLEEGKRVGLHETLYPVMQGYDSYFLDTDIQVGGPDQTFNMQAGRRLQKDLRNKESYVLVTDYLMGTDGRKMSKSWGNAIWIDDEPSNMYGKIMSVRDELIETYFKLATEVGLESIGKGNPLELKHKLARIIVSEIHGEQSATEASEQFGNAFQKGEGDYKREITMKPTLLETVAQEVGSNAEAKRLIKGGAVDVEEKTVTDPKLEIMGGERVKIGKKIFVKVKRT